MKISILSFALLALNSNYSVTAQAPALQWQRSIGGTDDDDAFSIQQTSDGGYIIAGSSKSNDGDFTGNHGGYDYSISKLDGAGNIAWNKSLGGSGDDMASSIQQTSDGGYIVAGKSNSTDGDATGNNGQFDYWIVKLDPSGNISWQKSLGGSDDDYANCIQQTTDGGFIVVGDTYSIDGDVTGLHGWGDFWIVKLNISGDITWQRSLGGTNFDGAESIQQTTDGGYIVAGLSGSNDGDVTVNNGQYDFWIVKLDDTGSISWQKSFGGNSDDVALSIQQTADGGYVVAGLTTSITGFWDYWIIKLDGIGSISWDSVVGGGNSDRAASIQQTIDEGYIVAGNTGSNDGDVTGNHGNVDSWVVKLDNVGIISWQKSLGGNNNDYANSVIQIADGSYVVLGLSDSNNGDVSGNHGGFDSWIVKLDAESGLKEIDTLKLSIYPNPTSGKLIITSVYEEIGKPYSITDVLGNIVSQGIINSISVELDITLFDSGVYYIYTENAIATKLVKL